MNKYELEKTAQELNDIAGIPWNEERAMELARALIAHYKWEDKPKEDKTQLEIPFKEE